MDTKSNGNYVCCKCNEKLTPQKVEFSYLNVDFSQDMLRCPNCGLIYIPEDIVVSRMSEVEMMLEGK